MVEHREEIDPYQADDLLQSFYLFMWYHFHGERVTYERMVSEGIMPSRSMRGGT